MKLTQQNINTRNLMGMTHQDLEQYFSVVGEKSFRATQIMKWTHQQGITDYNKMTNLSKSLRDWLNKNAQMQMPEMISEEISTDGTRKWLLRVDDKNAVETVYIPEDDRATLCVSSQVGCILDCTFCATARQGFAGNLKPSANRNPERFSPWRSFGHCRQPRRQYPLRQRSR